MTYFLREIWGYMCVIELHFMVTYRRMYGKEKAEKEREKKQENLKEKHEEIQHLNITRDPRTEKDTGLKSNDI